MASPLLHFRPKHRQLLRHTITTLHFSSSSSNNNNNNNQTRPSFLSDIKSSPKQPQSSQSQSHRPSIINSNPKPKTTAQKVAYLEEVRKTLIERCRSAVTPPPPTPSSPISYQRNVMPKLDSGAGTGTGSGPASLGAIWYVRSNLTRAIEQAKDCPSEITRLNTMLVKFIEDQMSRKKAKDPENVYDDNFVGVSQEDNMRDFILSWIESPHHECPKKKIDDLQGKK